MVKTLKLQWLKDELTLHKALVARVKFKKSWRDSKIFESRI